MNIIKIMVIDDSSVVRRAFSLLVENTRDIELVGTASNPVIAQKKMVRLNPDVIILDLEMPVMDGLTFLKKQMTENPLPIIICSSQSERGSQNAIKAMEYGAVDILEKPRLGTSEFFESSAQHIQRVIRGAAQARISRLRGVRKTVQPRFTADVIIPPPALNRKIEVNDQVIVVGASTGGTEALKVFLQGLPLNSPGVVIVQHMPKYFTKSFAQRLDSICSLKVKEAEDRDQVRSGEVLIAPGDRHILLMGQRGSFYINLKDGALVSRHKPSVDVLFRSAARFHGGKIHGVILTGMGDDGAKGLQELKGAGATTYAQDESTCVVFGMPKEAIKRDCVDYILPLKKIASQITSNINKY